MTLPGAAPPAPPWGQQPYRPGPSLRGRIDEDPSAAGQVALVLGAGGAFGPDVVGALQLRGHGAVVGADVQLTYPVKGTHYRLLDLSDPAAVTRFFRDLRAWAADQGLALGTVYDLSAVQTSPTSDTERDLGPGKRAVIDALCETEGDARLFHMSTAEVYGAPEGAPYAEDHEKAPFNPYAREKWAEEQLILGFHGRRTRSGTLKVVALRTWTIVMVDEDDAGRVVCARNYNDPLVMVAERLASAGVRIPLVEPDALATFHLGEEVAQAVLLLGEAPPDAATWGWVFNCTGAAATHRAIADAAWEVFAEVPGSRPWWAPLARLLLRRGRLSRRALERLAALLERAGGLGARDMASRLPFLYRSTHLDTRALREALGDRLGPEGDAVEAVRRLALGIREGGPDAVNLRRYRMY